MQHFIPTLGIRETSRNIKEFFAENKSVFFDVLKPLLPWFIGLYALDLIVSEFILEPAAEGEKERVFQLGAIISNYFLIALIITWHRVVIHGPDNYVPMNPFKPTKGELKFMGMAILIGFGLAIAAGAVIAVGAILYPPLIFPLAVIGIGVVLFLIYKFGFYFPARAAGQTIKLKESYRLTKGYFWKLYLSSFLASLKYIFLVFAYIFLTIALLGGLEYIIGDANGSQYVAVIIEFVIALPIIAYFYPILTIIGVTALSNFYLYAIQNTGHND